jgi:hypothetical protein
LNDALAGKTAWETAPDVVKYQRKQEQAQKEKQRKAMGETARPGGAEEAEMDARTQEYLRHTLGQLV